MLNNTPNARNVVLTNLCEILEDHAPSHIVLAKSLTLNDTLTKEDRSFIKQLTFGTVERCITLDTVIDMYSSVRVGKLKPVIRNILRMAVFQILFLNTPDSAACNEAVKLAKKRGFTGLAGFVNGILRKIVSEREKLIRSIDSTGSSASFRYSLPDWIVRYYEDYLGREKAEKAFEYFLKESTTQIRCNISRISPDELEKVLVSEGVSVKRRRRSDLSGLSGEDIPDACIDKCMTISDFDRIDSLNSFCKGLFTVQDFSSVLAGEHLKLQPGMTGIIDMCAAPGGKTVNLADRFAYEGIGAYLTACDISEQKLSLIRENAKRCGFDNIKALEADGTVFDESLSDRFDVVIADVPCSGLGVIARKPDIKYNTTPESIERLVLIQRNILSNAVRYLKRGGYMLFSTCTAGKRENEDNLDHLISLGMEKQVSKSIYPGEFESDGFFYAVLRKK